MSAHTAEKRVGGASSQRRQVIRRAVSRYGVLALLAVAIIVFSIHDPDLFLTWESARNILRQASLAAVVAFGVTLALSMGDFDLSIAGVMGLSGALAIHLMADLGYAWSLAVLAALGSGVAIGVLNGVFVAYLSTSSFIATLASGSVALAGASFFSGNEQIVEGIPGGFLELGTGKVLGVEMVFVVAAVAALILYLVSDKTESGRRMRAVGGSSEAARYSAVNVRLLRFAAFVAVALCAAVTGLMISAQSAAYTPDQGLPFLIPTYAAVFIGAAVLRNGQFHILGTVVGLLFLSVIQTGLIIMRLEAWITDIVQGLILMIAIVLSRLGASARD
jgi:ribose transport system permease protein